MALHARLVDGSAVTLDVARMVQPIRPTTQDLRTILVAVYLNQVDAIDAFRERLRSLDIADHFWVYS